MSRGPVLHPCDGAASAAGVFALVAGALRKRRGLLMPTRVRSVVLSTHGSLILPFVPGV